MERSLDKTFFVFWMGFIRKLDFKKLDKINLTFFVSNLMKVKKLETRYYGYFYYRYQEINTGDYWSILVVLVLLELQVTYFKIVGFF